MHYRETVVWTRAMRVAREVYGLARLLPREEMYGMRAQMTRAEVSVPSNIAEGWTRESKAEKRQFLAVAQGSLAELETQLTLCEEIGWFSIAQTKPLRQDIDETSRILTALRRRWRLQAQPRGEE
ncbi:MAG: four helix bundle protein [Xanthomonadaceae bacterium]|jgi:four helix bundle protein|nr:four helix bundle protein [Xanthomonadaceae bacterium]